MFQMLVDQRLPEEEPLPRIRKRRLDRMVVSQLCHGNFRFRPLNALKEPTNVKSSVFGRVRQSTANGPGSDSHPTLWVLTGISHRYHVQSEEFATSIQPPYRRVPAG